MIGTFSNNKYKVQHHKGGLLKHRPPKYIKGRDAKTEVDSLH